MGSASEEAYLIMENQFVCGDVDLLCLILCFELNLALSLFSFWCTLVCARVCVALCLESRFAPEQQQQQPNDCVLASLSRFPAFALNFVPRLLSRFSFLCKRCGRKFCELVVLLLGFAVWPGAENLWNL